MPTETLAFSLPHQKPGYLTVKVTNISGVVLDEPLTIEFHLPTEVVAAGLEQAAIKADSCDPAAKSVELLVTGVGPCSAWAKPDRSPKLMILMLRNDLKLTGMEQGCDQIEQIDPPAKLELGTELTILIPLNPAAASYRSIEIPYSYEYGANGVIHGKLTLESAGTDDWQPDVWLKSNQTNPTAIEPMQNVRISWHIGSGVSATLRGPLAGGNSQVTLSDSSKSDYKLTDGSFDFIAIGPVTYLLQAEVSREGKPNVQVMKAITLDIQTGRNNGYLEAYPIHVLPFGPVKIDWAAWGVDVAIINIGNISWEIRLTELTVNREHQGAGDITTTAGEPSDRHPLTTPVNLMAQIKDKIKELATTKFYVIPWRKMKPSNFEGQPIGLATIAPHMALLTTSGLWIAGNIGTNDLSPRNYDTVDEVTFNRAPITDTPKAWLGLAALDQNFVVLRQSNQDDLQVARYTAEGRLDGNPIDLPSELRPLIKVGANLDLAVYGGRIYVVVETRATLNRRAFSVSFSATQKIREEPLLNGLPGFRLVVFDNALYAFNRDSGQLLRFPLKTDGTLELPLKAASAISSGSSMIKQGQLVPVGRVLAVLGPSSLPSAASLKSAGLRNVLKHRRVGPLRSPNTFQQDIVYNPQQDHWIRCGHGLEIKPGMVCASRGTGPRRLWMIDPTNKDTHTLTVSSEQLFAHDYLPQTASAKLTSFFNTKRGLMFINNTGMEFVPMNETCMKAGLMPFSATGVAQLSSPIPTGLTNPKRSEPVDLGYNEASPPAAVTLRLLAKRGPGINHEYVLEMTLSGPRFSYSSICFKRLTPDAQGGVSVTEMPGKLEGPVSLGLIERFPMQLSNGIRLRINNRTPYTLWLRSPYATTPADLEKKYDSGEVINIRYNTSPFSIYAHGVGELPVDVDFALPQGIEISPGSEVQKTRIRIRHDGPRVFEIESPSIQETSEYDAYEFTLRYRTQKTLNYAYLGDGVPSNDGASIYLPVAKPDATDALILTIDANSLGLGRQGVIERRKNIFSRPNSVAVLSDRVVAIVNGEHLKVFDHALIPKPGLPLRELEYDVITHLKSSPNHSSLFILGMKEQPTWQIPHSYRFDCMALSPYPHQQSYRIMDFFKSTRRSRVPGAPPWVAPNTISPMDVRPGGVMAICVEGGIIGVDLNSDREIDVDLPGTGREEAILVDPTEPLIFCAHSRADGSGGLMVSRISSANPREKLTKELSGNVTHMVRDSRPVPSQNFEYNRQSSVSLLATSDTLFVSHQYKILALDKTTLTSRQGISFNLPVRLIQVRRGKPPGENHPKYGVPQDCYFIWAIGSRYFGDGQTVNAQDYGKFWETVLYKVALVT